MGLREFHWCFFTKIYFIFDVYYIAKKHEYLYGPLIRVGRVEVGEINVSGFFFSCAYRVGGKRDPFFSVKLHQCLEMQMIIRCHCRGPDVGNSVPRVLPE